MFYNAENNHAYIPFSLCIAPTGAPLNFTVSVENTSLSFEWDPPAEDERRGVLVSYTLSCSGPNDEGFETDLNVIEAVSLDEFLPSTNYSCTIYASTNGGGGPTASVSATTDGKSIIVS